MLVMSLNINAIETCTDIPECMSAEEIRYASIEDNYMDALLTCMIHRWSSTRTEVIKEVQPYWSLKDEIVVIDQMVMKVKMINTSIPVERSTESATCHPQGYREYKVICLWIHLLDKY